jgi:proteasome assembly chaperone (PAC2) family protein
LLLELLKKYMEKCVIILKVQGRIVNTESLSHVLDILVKQFQTESEYDSLEDLCREKEFGMEKWKEITLNPIKMEEFATIWYPKTKA